MFFPQDVSGRNLKGGVMAIWQKESGRTVNVDEKAKVSLFQGGNFSTVFWAANEELI